MSEDAPAPNPMLDLGCRLAALIIVASLTAAAGILNGWLAGEVRLAALFERSGRVAAPLVLAVGIGAQILWIGFLGWSAVAFLLGGSLAD